MSRLIIDLRKVPVIRVLVPFGCGIFLSYLNTGGYAIFQPDLLVIIELLLLFLSLLILNIEKHFFDILFRLIIVIFFIVAGIICHGIQTASASSALDDQELVVLGSVIGEKLEKQNTYLFSLCCTNYILDDSIVPFRQNLLVYIKKDISVPDIIPGQVWTMGGKIKKISARGNPGEFDYRAYMQRKNYNYSLFIDDASLLKVLNACPEDLKNLPSRIRQKMMKNWDKKNRDIAVLSALTLGNKSLLDRDTKKAFADAGGMHLLAVSGLHVGIVWWMLDILLRFPSNRSYWRTLKLIIILLILWFYAGITGFSESVSRSVTMFSMLAFSKSLQRQSNIFNTLLLSAFILLILKPARIAEPGFQLSYFAVFGIITLQPTLEKFYEYKNRILKYIFDLVYVSIAAQIATLPLVLFYFHQFPVWFLLTNIIAIPLVSLILALFVLFSPILLLHPEIECCILILKYMVHFLNSIMNFISSLPYAVINEIAITRGGSLLMIIGIVFLIAYVSYKQIYFLLLAVFMSVCLLIYSSIYQLKLYRMDSFEVYNFKNSTVCSDLNKSVRTSYIFNHTELSDPYLQDYLKSLNRIPAKLRLHTIIDIHNENINGSNLLYTIADGLWGISTCNQHILIIGNCTNRALDNTMESYNWDILLLTRGFPMHFSFTDKADSQIIGDGSLRQFEVEFLKDKISNSFIISSEGAFVLKTEVYINRLIRSATRN